MIYTNVLTYFKVYFQYYKTIDSPLLTDTSRRKRIDKLHCDTM